MSKKERISLLDEAPIRPPILATKMWGIIAICTVIGFLPSIALVFYLWAKLTMWVRSEFHIQLCQPVYVLLFIAIVVCSLTPLYVGSMVASLYILKLVKFYLDNNEPEKAEKVAEAFAIKVWNWHAKRRPWFRQFVVNERIPRYSKL